MYTVKNKFDDYRYVYFFNYRIGGVENLNRKLKFNKIILSNKFKFHRRVNITFSNFIYFFYIITIKL